MAEGTSKQSTPRDVSVGIGPAGAQRHVPGRWATFAVNGMNRTDEDREEIGIAMVGDSTSLQYGRKFWIPAHSRRQAWISMKIPSTIYADSLQTPLTTIHLKQTEQGEAFESNVVGMPTSERSLLISWEESRAAAILDGTESGMAGVELTETLAKTVYAGRDAVVADTQDLGLSRLGGTFLPPTANPLDSLDRGHDAHSGARSGGDSGGARGGSGGWSRSDAEQMDEEKHDKSRAVCIRLQNMTVVQGP